MTAVSVCIPTYRRPGPLADALEAICSLDPPADGFEIVVVDDGSPDDDRVGAVLEAAAAESPVSLRWHRLAENRGPAAARNEAVRLATGTWVAFTDDDCRPAKDWLVRLVARAESAGADVVQGRTVPEPTKVDLLAEPWARSMAVAEQNEYFQTCNILYRRALLEALGGFDEAFRLIGDDTDLGWRAVAAGATVAFAADAVVAHDVVVRGFLADLRSRRRWTDTIRVIRKHPASRRLAWRPYVYRRSHVPLLVLAATAPALASRRARRWWIAGLVALASGDVVRAGSPRRAVVALEQRVADAYEIALLARESVRERVVLL